MIRNEDAHQVYSTNVLCAIFEAESNGLFEVRQTILGHVQRAASVAISTAFRPRAFAAAASISDRTGRRRNAGRVHRAGSGRHHAALAGRIPKMVGQRQSTAQAAWWLDVRGIAKLMSQPMPGGQLMSEK